MGSFSLLVYVYVMERGSGWLSASIVCLQSAAGLPFLSVCVWIGGEKEQFGWGLSPLFMGDVVGPVGGRRERERERGISTSARER